MSTQDAPPTKIEMPTPQTQPQATSPMTQQPQDQRATGPASGWQEPPAYGRAGASLSGVYYDYGTSSLPFSLITA